MNDVLTTLRNFLASDQGAKLPGALLLLVAGFVLARLAAAALGRLLASRATRQQRLLARRLTYYGVLSLFLVSALVHAGLNLSPLLGAAGIATVALGFASQTSVSNVISGLFLLGERAFQVGDVITVDNTTGEVVSIDWLSVKLRTYDNLFIRMPNETMLKSQITNVTRFPIRRFDLHLGFAYHQDFKQVCDVLLAAADQNPLCLDEPRPLIIHRGFGESSIDVQFSVWAARDTFLDMRNEICRDVKAAFDQAGVEIPFPQRSLTIHPTSAPLPVEITR
ncbi:MAG: mechanosensitive ion channel family protein [Acidobacteria bacterium]|nr:MAG: mechanosensitive ion channel family protein [Acidobacteriota bacterium]